MPSIGLVSLPNVGSVRSISTDNMDPHAAFFRIPPESFSSTLAAAIELFLLLPDGHFWINAVEIDVYQLTTMFIMESISPKNGVLNAVLVVDIIKIEHRSINAIVIDLLYSATTSANSMRRIIPVNHKNLNEDNQYKYSEKCDDHEETQVSPSVPVPFSLSMCVFGTGIDRVSKQMQFTVIVQRV